jgi:hypothetical protein
VRHLLSDELKFEIGRPTESIGMSYVIAKDRHIDEEQVGRHLALCGTTIAPKTKISLPTKEE